MNEAELNGFARAVRKVVREELKPVNKRLDGLFPSSLLRRWRREFLAWWKLPWRRRSLRYWKSKFLAWWRVSL